MRQTSRAGAALAGLAAVLLAGAVPAQAGEARVVSGADTGTTGTGDMFLTYVGCDDFFSPAAPPTARVNLGPHAVPAGRRSLGLVPGMAGTASGPRSAFASLAGLNDSVAVTSTSGTSGVSWVWASTSLVPGAAWRGRADLTISAGGWHHIRAADLTYTWTLVDLATRKIVADAGRATPAGFARDHNSGAGFVVTGFGCDAAAFNIDAVHAAGTTWDFEGVALTTRADAPAAAPAGTTITVTGVVADASGRKTGDPLILQTLTGDGTWIDATEPVLADPDGVTRVDVALDDTTTFRWHRPESQYADEGFSNTVTTRVTDRVSPGLQGSSENPSRVVKYWRRSDTFGDTFEPDTAVRRASHRAVMGPSRGRSERVRHGPCCSLVADETRSSVRSDRRLRLPRGPETLAASTSLDKCAPSAVDVVGGATDGSG